MNAVPIRKANLQDLMVLTGWTAIGLAVARYYGMAPTSLAPALNGQGLLYFDPGYPTRDVRWWATIGSIFLAAWSVALLCAKLRSPRPKFRAMLGSPGFLVSATATILTLSFFAEKLATTANDGWPNFDVPAMSGNQILQGKLDLFPQEVFPRLRRSVGVAVTVALLVSLAASRRRAASDWVDRWGLILGSAWAAICWL